MFWKKSALLLVFVQPYKEESVPGIGDTGSVPVWLVVLSCGRNGEEEACLISGAIQCPRTCQGPESMLLYRSGLPMASSVSGLGVIREGGPDLFMGVF